jgi:hypothetical protein
VEESRLFLFAKERREIEVFTCEYIGSFTLKTTPWGEIERKLAL